MNTKNIYFAISLLLFVLVFYENEVGINLGFWSIIVFVFAYFLQANKKKITKNFNISIMGGIVSALAFSYYQDEISFLSLFISWHLIAMQMFDIQLDWLKGFLVVPLNYLMLLPNLLESKWKVSSKKSTATFQRIFALVIIPLIIVSIFGFIYSLASKTVMDFFDSFTFQINWNPGVVIGLSVFGFLLLFSFFNFKLPENWEFVYKSYNSDFQLNTALSAPNEKKLTRQSGEITFLLLNLVLLIFIGIYGYENFNISVTEDSISESVHNRVGAVIVSIVLAIGLILYFFKGYFNFDVDNQRLKQLTFTWILLNSVLIFVTAMRNFHYVQILGLTEKRLGVFAFLIVALIGLIYTYIKVKNQKTNAYLLKNMVKVFYFTFLVVAVFNWSWIITKYNIVNDKFISNYQYHKELRYNNLIMLNTLKNENSYMFQDYKKSIYYRKELQLGGNFYDYYVNSQISKNGQNH